LSLEHGGKRRGAGRKTAEQETHGKPWLVGRDPVPAERRRGWLRPSGRLQRAQTRSESIVAEKPVDRHDRLLSRLKTSPLPRWRIAVARAGRRPSARCILGFTYLAPLGAEVCVSGWTLSPAALVNHPAGNNPARNMFRLAFQSRSIITSFFSFVGQHPEELRRVGAAGSSGTPGSS
jgi:hypothetical protein